MKQQNLLLVFALCVLFLPACTVHKRTVNKGYFIQWNFNKKNKGAALPDKDQYRRPTWEYNHAEIPAPEIYTEENLVTENEPVISADNMSFPEIGGTTTEKQNPVKNIVSGQEKKTTIKKQVEIRRQAAEISDNSTQVDWELTINIVLTVVFLGLAILFTFLAIAAGSGLMLFVWAGLALVSFIIFVTQVIDLIMW